MQGLKGVIVIATIVAATVALGGCFGHHEKAVTHEPLSVTWWWMSVGLGANVTSPPSPTNTSRISAGR